MKHTLINSEFSIEVWWRIPIIISTRFITIQLIIFIDAYHLTHWGRVTHICVGKLTIIGIDNGFSPGWRQAIIWTNAGILLIGPLGTNFSEILIGIQTFSFKKMHFKMSSAKWRSFFSRLQCVKAKISTWSLNTVFWTNPGVCLWK